MAPRGASKPAFPADRLTFDPDALALQIRQTAVYSRVVVRNAQERLNSAVKRAARARQVLERNRQSKSLVDDDDVERLINAHVEHGARERDRVIAVLSHELRQPLNAALAASQLLRGAGDDSMASRARQVLERQLHHMVRLLDDLQELAKLRTRTIVLQQVDLDLCETVAAAIETLLARAADNGITMTLDAPNDPVPLKGDPNRLRQVFINLLSNALAHTPAGGSVSVAIRPGGPLAIVEVIDSGDGIPPDDLTAIFEPFHKGTSGPSEGLGIGLTIVRSLVEAHGGAVGASSAGVGTGTTFTVALPTIEQQ